MSRPLSAARQKYYKYRRFIRNTTAASILNYACVILYCVPLFAHAKGEEDHLASSQITIAGFAPQRNCILGSFSLALTQSAIMFSLPLKLQDDAGCCCFGFVLFFYYAALSVALRIARMSLRFDLSVQTVSANAMFTCLNVIIRHVGTQMGSLISKAAVTLSAP